MRHALIRVCFLVGLGSFFVGFAGCDDSDAANTASATCSAKAGCIDAGSRGGQTDGAVSYGDNNSGALVWPTGGSVVFDSQSGLLWQRESSAQRFQWQAALAVCDGLNLGGFSDWKLPHRQELESIVLNLTTAPSIDTLAFPTTPSKPFWTRTLWSSDPEFQAYGVDFNDGGTGRAQKTEPHFVRCVRQP